MKAVDAWVEWWRMIPGLALLAGLALLSGCYASNVVAREDRAVVDLAVTAWQPGPPEVLGELYESVELNGEAAAQLWKIYYLFEASRHYSAAALIIGDDGRSFQIHDGDWEITRDGLRLDGADAVPMQHAPEYIRLNAASGSVVLRRVELK